MTYQDLIERSVVLAAFAEFDQIGRERFLAKYGFGPAYYYIEHGDKFCDSKSIVAAAHGYQHDDPLPNTFTGGRHRRSLAGTARVCSYAPGRIA